MRLFCVFLLAVPVWADRCTLPAGVAEFVQTLPAERGARHQSLGEAARAKPDDFHLNRLFLDGSVYEKQAVREQYRREYETHPGDLDYTYLYARSLVGSNTPEALRVYSQILAKDPDYPWVHLSQLEIFRAEPFRDRKKLESSFMTLRRACPALWEPYEYLGEIDNAGLVAREAANLRELLATSKDPRTVVLYRALWAAEFRGRSPAGQEVERQIVAADLKRLGALERTPELRTVLANGARLTGDQTLVKELAPPPRFDPGNERSAWNKAHPRPQPGDPPEQKRAWAQAQLAEATRWIARAPAERRTLAYTDRLKALVALDAPADEIGQAGDELLALTRSRSAGSYAPFLAVARAYMDRGVLLDRVPGILQEALIHIDDPEAVIEIDLAPAPEHTAINRMAFVDDHANAAAMLSEFDEKQGQPDTAAAVLQSLADYLAAKAPPHDGKHSAVERIYGTARFYYWRQRAALAEHAGLKLDALVAYREAAVSLGHSSEELLAAERRLWTGLGGSNEAWVQWLNTVRDPAQLGKEPDRVVFAPLNRPLPDFTLKDIAGGTWTPDRLKGKTTIAAVWATWCEPCRAELPHLAKLADALKSRGGVQVIALNTDENAGAVEPFVKQSGYGFPVLLAQHFAEDLMPVFAIPRTWIVRDGVLVAETVGFGDPEQWREAVLAQIK